MKAAFFNRLTALVPLFATCWALAQGQEPVSGSLQFADHEASLETAPINGGFPSNGTTQIDQTDTQACVLLTNGNVLFGNARQLGEFVIVTTAAGGEVRLQRVNVSCWADSIRSLYQYRVDQRGKPTLRDHLRDAWWCVRYDLYDLAARELIAAKRIDPDNREANALETRLRSLVNLQPADESGVRPTDSNSMKPNVITGESGAISPAVFEEENSQNFEVDPLVIRRFASHIQPMLLSRCGVCHQSMLRPVERGLPLADWHLIVPSVGSRASASITHNNLHGVIPYIDENNPEESLLLSKATTPHGGGAAPLNQRNTKAMQSLGQWVRMIASSLRNVKQNPNEPSVGLRSTHGDPGDGNVSDVTTLEKALLQNESQSASEPVVQSAKASFDQGARSTPQRLPPVSNPFDPDLFNRRFHPAGHD